MEMALLSNKFEPVGNENLDKNWKHVGSGGFGHVYKARHKDWRHDVAIKILKTDVGYKEADLMVTASSEFVLRVYGTYKGCPPFSRSTQHGIVMQFMEMGSVESLREDPPHPPPWPLAFRLAREVALGVNFLHLKKIVHQDLKPSNVLLTENLNARLADFGLSRVSTSALTSSSEQTGETGGTYKYMPPEAFDASYKPVRAFDIYSYGILLWSIVTGEEPYPGRTALVPLSIPDGQRPPCEDLEKMAVEGLKELVHLMKRCWDGDPNKRPKIDEVLEETEEVFSKHKRAIRDAVDQVLKRLDSPNGNQRSETSASNRRPPHQAPERSKSIDEVDMPSPITRHPPTQGMRREVFHQDASHSSAKHMTDEEKENFVNVKKADLIQRVKLVVKIAEELGNMVNPETYDNIRAEKTSREQMRVLYTLLDSEGKKIKAAFYDALKRNHQLLVEDLGGF
ncbi:receptor-interacting serine/threonine-protein kinase 3-like isoform X2 [Sparus aurata]|uniref:receptor-interacting serine/threonine-protein kinase 3-like isoform X2 n=1 Tax=Sparus aurata TaxID=8175 RepID=UPI0011C150F4|nr:receptor-interacting serine/threonine-protein kinase 3-like isoform X2 [Sparus aurata]